MGTAEPGLRADARRNYDRLLSAARDAFAEQGTEASLRDVARRAGVGIGTLYRHFPTREALLEALIRNGFDKLRARAEELLTEPHAGEALACWLREFSTGSTAYRGLPESVLSALRDETSELYSACKAMRDAGGRLLHRAQQAGQLRSDVTVTEMFTLAAGIAWAADQTSRPADRLLTLVTEGLQTSSGPAG